jgi:large subunit ribosomal protein L15
MKADKLHYSSVIPKRGFTNVSRKDYAIVNVEDLCVFAAGEEVTFESLRAKGLVSKQKDGLKILGNGKLEISLTVKANKYSLNQPKKAL